MGAFRVFLMDYERDRDIPAEEPITRTLEETLDEFDRLSDTEGNFLGICLPGGGVVQFIYDDEEGLTIDVPQPERRGSLTRSASFDECRRIIEGLGRDSSPTAIPGLFFTPWDQG